MPHQSLTPPSENCCDKDPKHVLFKNDHIYSHRILRINYTTYDIRRVQDVINPRTTHHNVILLADTETEDGEVPQHPYHYACVLGIYHANIVYVGPGMIDYKPRHLDFLWVRWYQRCDTTKTSDMLGWNTHHLDQLCFPSMVSEGAFGFVDPSNIL